MTRSICGTRHQQPRELPTLPRPEYPPVTRPNSHLQHRLIRALATLLIATAVAPTVHAQQPALSACATAYHASLEVLRAKRGDSLAQAVTVLKAPDVSLPGRWLYAQSLFPNTKKTRPIEVERTCLERTKVAGRLRCTKYDEPAAPQIPAELTISPAPNAEEMRIFRAFNDLVEGRGGVPEVGNNGRYFWLAQRAASDLKLYISQPAHPALCAGGKDFAEFYANSMKSLQKRIDEVTDLSKKARALAFARVADASIQSSTPSTAPGTAPNTGSDAKPETPAPARPADAPLVVLIADAVRPVLPASAVADVAAETTPLAALRRAKAALVAAQVEAQAAEDAKPRDRILGSARAIRMLEAAAYGEIYVERYKKFTADVISFPQQIIATHAAACTCSP
jgi:hypothetical protein